MASYRNIVLIALLFLIATTPRTHGVVIGGASKVSVVGFLYCGVPGILHTSSSLPLRRASVNVTCDGGMITLGQAVTDTAGFLNATFNVEKGRLFDASTCMATVNVSSFTRCSVFPQTGVLRLTLVLVSILDRVVQIVTGVILI